jgi:chorismate synthase
MRYFTAGESHGPELTAIIDGLPSGLSLNAEQVNVSLKRRQGGYGRGGRMKIESDQVRFSSGLRHGKTLGSPLTMVVQNRDHQNWLEVMSPEAVAPEKEGIRKLTKPRPGHADLVGGMKYDFADLRNVLERSSARETTMRVAIGAVAKVLLAELGIQVTNHVVSFGGIKVTVPDDMTFDAIEAAARQSDVSIVNPEQDDEIHELIDQTKQSGDTIGGEIEILVHGLPAGIGSYTQWDRKLDGKLAQAVMSVNAIKGVEFGLGFEAAHLPGSQVMDEITYSLENGYSRSSNHLGGFEGGMTNGQDIIIRAAMKPIPTLYKPLMSVDIETHELYQAQVERSDPTAVPAAGVVLEHVVATVIAQEILDQFTSDSMDDLTQAIDAWREKMSTY